MLRIQGLAFLTALALLWGVALPATSKFFPVDEITAGMKAQGKTVFSGDRVEPFTAEILGVLKNVIGPQRTLVLARLGGGPIETAGVIAGMSGSPVYIDGRLVGAVAYSLGAFSKEPIAGITPIGEMIEAAALDSPRRRLAAVKLPRGAGVDDTLAQVRRAFSVLQPFAHSPFDTQSMSPGLPALASTAGMLRPIATPLGLSGFSTSTLAPLERMLYAAGFLPNMTGSAPPRTNTVTRPLRGGDAVGITLVSGDLEIGATGTVTAVDGDAVYAFGHPFYNLGPTTFPMTRAWVHAILPSLQSSMRIASSGAVIGTIHQDRATTVAGLLGAGPALMPVTLNLTTAGTTRTFRVRVAHDQLFTPLMTYLAIVETLTSYQRQMGAATYAVKGRAVLKDHGEIAFDDLFTGDQAPMGAANAVMGPLNALMRNTDEDVLFEHITLDITASEEARTATLERVTIDPGPVRPGQTLPVTLHARTFRGAPVSRTIPITIPPQARGAVSIRVSDAFHLAGDDSKSVSTAQMRSLPQLLRALSKVRHNNRFYVRLVTPNAGAAVQGESLTALPASVVSVFEGDRQGGSFRGLPNALSGDWEVVLDYVVSGSRTITIPID